MYSEDEMESARNENRLVLALGAMVIAVVIVTVCVGSGILLFLQQETRATAEQNTPVVFVPAAELPAVVSASHLILLPVIQSGRPAAISISEPETGQIWEVTRIKTLGYELDGRNYDLATFKRVGGQDTAKGYCINRGWDVPDIGTEYLLNSDGIFVPLQEPDGDPFQRFMLIQP